MNRIILWTRKSMLCSYWTTRNCIFFNFVYFLLFFFHPFFFLCILLYLLMFDMYKYLCGLYFYLIIVYFDIVLRFDVFKYDFLCDNSYIIFFIFFFLSFIQEKNDTTYINIHDQAFVTILQLPQLLLLYFI